MSSKKQALEPDEVSDYGTESKSELVDDHLLESSESRSNLTNQSSDAIQKVLQSHLNLQITSLYQNLVQKAPFLKQ